MLSFAGAASLRSGARAQEMRVMESAPTTHAVIGGGGNEFFVRFDKPVDHNRSSLVIKRGDEIVETLRPRLASAPQVLFARTPSLPPGDYVLHWQAVGMSGQEIVQGDIPFTVRH